MPYLQLIRTSDNIELATHLYTLKRFRPQCLKRFRPQCLRRFRPQCLRRFRPQCLRRFIYLYLEKYCINVTCFKCQLASLLAQAVLKLTRSRFACVRIFLYACSCVCTLPLSPMFTCVYYAYTQWFVYCVHVHTGLCVRSLVPTI